MLWGIVVRSAYRVRGPKALRTAARAGGRPVHLWLETATAAAMETRIEFGGSAIDWKLPILSVSVTAPAQVSWRLILEINVKGCFEAVHCCQASLRRVLLLTLTNPCSKKVTALSLGTNGPAIAPESSFARRTARPSETHSAIFLRAGCRQASRRRIAGRPRGHSLVIDRAPERLAGHGQGSQAGVLAERCPMRSPARISGKARRSASGSRRRRPRTRRARDRRRDGKPPSGPEAADRPRSAGVPLRT